MTEFDEWWRNKNKEGYYRHCTDVALDIWKAALERALTQETDLQQTELGAAIREELKNRTS